MTMTLTPPTDQSGRTVCMMRGPRDPGPALQLGDDSVKPSRPSLTPQVQNLVVGPDNLGRLYLPCIHRLLYQSHVSRFSIVDTYPNHLSP